MEIDEARLAVQDWERGKKLGAGSRVREVWQIASVKKRNSLGFDWLLGQQKKKREKKLGVFVFVGWQFRFRKGRRGWRFSLKRKGDRLVHWRPKRESSKKGELRQEAFL